MKTLNLHAGGNHVTRQELIAAPTPAATATHFPIPHVLLLKSTEDMLTGSQGFKIIKEEHALDHNGDRYFGLLTLSKNGEDYDDRSLCVGLRNSHDKTFCSELVMGMSVFVCSNLSFSGEIKLSRKHTRFIEEDIPRLVIRAASALMTYRGKQDARVNAYKKAEITNVECHDVIIRALQAKAITTTQIPDVLAQWEKPEYDDFKDRNMWSLFNSFTSVYKKQSIELCNRRSQLLHGVLDSYLSLAV